jgi:phosphate acetyltransferase
MLPLEKIFEKARSQPRHIVLAEGEDPRVIQAALCAEQEKIAHITLLGSADVIADQIAGTRIQIIDPAMSDKYADYADKLHQLRHAKGMTEEQALKIVKTPLGFAAMMVLSPVQLPPQPMLSATRCRLSERLKAHRLFRVFF